MDAAGADALGFFAAAFFTGFFAEDFLAAAFFAGFLAGVFAMVSASRFTSSPPPERAAFFARFETLSPDSTIGTRANSARETDGLWCGRVGRNRREAERRLPARVDFHPLQGAGPLGQAR